MRDLVDLMLETPETLAAAVAMIEVRDMLSDRMTRRFTAIVEERAKAAGLGSVRPASGDVPLFYGSRYGTLRLDIGDPRFDFAIQADATNFREVVVGVCMRTKTEALAKVCVREIAQLNQLLGAGTGEVAEHWWLWCEHAATLDVSGGQTESSPALWKWAAEQSDSGLAACFVSRALDAKQALRS